MRSESHSSEGQQCRFGAAKVQVQDFNAEGET